MALPHRSERKDTVDGVLSYFTDEKNWAGEVPAQNGRFGGREEDGSSEILLGVGRVCNWPDLPELRSQSLTCLIRMPN